MANRLVSVDDNFNLPAAVNVLDGNLPARLGEAALSSTYATKAELTDAGLKIVNHGDDATFPRPDTTSAVLWIGTVTPDNRIAGDQYYLVATEPVPFSVLALEPTLWLDAQALTTTLGTSTATWNDLSGNNYHAALGAEGVGPIISTAINGHQAAVFANNTYLDTPAFAGIPANSPVTVLIVAKNNTAQGGGLTKVIYDGGTSVSTNKLWLQKLGTDEWNMGRGSMSISSTILADTLPHLFVSKHAAAGSLTIDGTEVAAGGLQTDAPNMLKLRLGARSDAAANFEGAIGEVIVVHRILTTSELADASAYLNAKWGL